MWQVYITTFLPFWKELFCRFREYVVAEARKFGAGLVSLEAREFRSGGGGHWFNPWGGSGNNWLFLNFFKASEVNMIVLVVEVGGIEPLECLFLWVSLTNSISFQPENKKYKMKYSCELFLHFAVFYNFQVSDMNTQINVSIRLVIFLRIKVFRNSKD